MFGGLARRPQAGEQPGHLLGRQWQGIPTHSARVSIKLGSPTSRRQMTNSASWLIGDDWRAAGGRMEAAGHAVGVNPGTFKAMGNI